MVLYSYVHKIRLSSSIFREQMNTPLETAIHWVKHVAKTKGAPHLKSVAVDLPFYMYYNLDAWAFIGSGLTLIIFLIVKRLKSFADTLNFSNPYNGPNKNKLQF